MTNSFDWSVESTILEANPDCTKHLIKKIIDQSQCPVCQEYMFVPVITKCGHNFCYQCLSAWLCTSETCPSCRAIITEVPYFNNPVQNTVNALMDTLKSLNGDILPADIVRDRDMKIKEYKHDEKRNNLYKKVFSQTGEAVIDTSDGVARCSECHWEVEGNRCPNCHLRLRNPYADENMDSDDMDSDFEADLRRMEEHHNESDDSFIDNRELDELEIHDDNSVLSDGDFPEGDSVDYPPADPYSGSWQDEPFEDDFLSDDIEDEYREAIRRSMHRTAHHAVPISEDDEDEDESARETVNVLSDDDEEGERYTLSQRRNRRFISVASDEDDE